MDFKDKRVTVMGLGLHGGSEGLIKYLVNQGAIVRVTDQKTEDELKATIENLKDYNIDYRLGKHTWDDFKDADMIFINQAVKPGSLWRKRIERSEIPTSSEMNLFFQNCQAPIIGITGTNGKSTTATLAYKILKTGLAKSGKKVFFGGNIGGSLLTKLSEITKDDLVVLELSSFQLMDLARIKKSPHIAVILNITPDHLDYHKDFSDYVDAKKNVMKFQDESDFLILNYDQKRTRSLGKDANARVLYFNSGGPIKIGSYLRDNTLFGNWRGNLQKVISTSDIRLKGRHNLENVLAAICVALIYKVKPEVMAEVIAEFRGLEHRIEYVGKIKEAKVYNDSKSTTPDSTIVALKSFKDPIVLLCGGSEKNTKFGKMAEEIIERCKAVVVFGQTSKRIKNIIEKKYPKVKLKKLKIDDVYLAHNLEDAYQRAKSILSDKEVLLLSPACASFDQFANFEERGKIFKELVKKDVDG